MYKALYRKYRPESFDDVVGQNTVKTILENSIKNNQVCHAYLFCGPRGTGKTSIAKILGKTLNCQNLNNTTPCNKCVCCTQYNNKQADDIIEMDAASNNGVDEIRDLKAKIDLVPSVGKYKIYIIDEVHMMTTGAFNALLKTLEEPPKHAIFILATTEPHKVPETILSRCQRLDFKPISIEDISNRIKYIASQEKIEIDDLAIEEIAKASNGGMRDSLSLLDQVNSYADGKIGVDDVKAVVGSSSNEKVKEITKYIIENDLINCLNCIDEEYKNGKDMLRYIEDIMLLLKNILIYKYTNSNDMNYETDNINLNEVDSEKVVSIINELNLVAKELKNYNNPKLLIEITFIKCLNFNNIEKKENTNNLKEKDKKNETINISQKKENQKENIKSDITINYEINPNMEKFREIRINNTLCNLNKKNMLNLKEMHENLKPLLIDPNYSNIISLILDGNIKAASDDHIIYVYDSSNMVKLFDESITEIEKVLFEKFQKNFKVISTDNISWEIIKKEFNSKTKKYIYQEEDESILNKENNSSNDEFLNMFGEIVEYN